MDPNNSIEFQDAEDWQGSFQNGISFREIVLNHVRTILKLGSCEFAGGYWSTKIISLGNSGASLNQKVWVADTGKAYSNAIQNLANMLHFHYDTQMRKAELEILNELGSISDKDKAVQLYGQLFRELCDFLGRSKYLELGNLEDR